jgi:hypothetical protein
MHYLLVSFRTHVGNGVWLKFIEFLAFRLIKYTQPRPIVNAPFTSARGSIYHESYLNTPLSTFASATPAHECLNNRTYDIKLRWIPQRKLQAQESAHDASRRDNRVVPPHVIITDICVPLEKLPDPNYHTFGRVQVRLQVCRGMNTQLAGYRVLV